MSIKEGYKQTKIGIIPNEWNIYALEELGTTFNGLSGKTKEDFGSGSPYIPYMNVFSNNKIDIDNVDLVSIESNENQNAIKYGDIFFTVSSETLEEVGLSSVLLEKLEKKVYLNSFCFGFRPNDFKNFLPEYSRFLFREFNTRKRIKFYANGTTRINISKVKLMKLQLALPPLEEQKKIADILSTVDQKIAFVEDNISQTQELKKGLMQKLLTEGIGHTEFKDSEVGRIPESWEVKEIGEISSVLDPHPSHRAPKEDSNGYPFVGIGDISVNGIIDIESSRKVSLKDIENQNSSISVNENDIGFGRVATVGKVIKFRGDYTIPFALSPTMAIMKVKDIQKEYFYQYLTSNMTKKQFKNFTSGSTRISLGIQNLRKLLVCIPPEEEQKQIAEILSTVDQKLEILKDKKQSFEELKKGLMQKLLTGEVRV